MNRYKKLTAALLCTTVLTFTVTGCGGTSNTAGNADVTNTEAAAQNVLSGTSGLKLEFDKEDLTTSWDSAAACKINLTGNEAIVEGSGATAEGSTVTITSAGTYVLSGTLKDGSICVNTADKEAVRIILNGVEVSSASTAPFMVADAKKVIVTLADNTNNTFTDSSRSTIESEDYSAAIASKADLVFNGNGTLTVNAGYRNGIKSSDDLKFVSGTYVVTAAEDGIIGKDLLGIADGTYTVKAGCDGMKSTYDTDTTKGNIILTGGSYKITAENDGIQAENILSIDDGAYELVTGVGSANAVMTTGNDIGMGGMRGGFNVSSQQTTTEAETETSDSAKGLKAANAVYVYGGTFNIDSEDDGIHTNSIVSIAGGTFTIKSGDDGIHADESLEINGGKVDIQYSYEGLEAGVITINEGEVKICAEDDGINASTGADSDSRFGMNRGFGNAAQTETEGSSASEKTAATLNINGGNVYVDADGDGLDSNGNITINGGTTVVCGPTSSGDTALDFDGQCVLNGGTLMAFGSNGMLETPTSAQNGSCIVTTFTSQNAGSEFTLTDSTGNTIMNYTPSKSYSAAIVYSSDIKSAQSYTVKAGSETQDITVNNSVTTAGSVSNMGGGMQNGGMKGGNMQKGAQSDSQSGEPSLEEIPSMSEMPSGQLPSGEMPSGKIPGGEMPSDDFRQNGNAL